MSGLVLAKRVAVVCLDWYTAPRPRPTESDVFRTSVSNEGAFGQVGCHPKGKGLKEEHAECRHILSALDTSLALFEASGKKVRLKYGFWGDSGTFL